MPLDPQAKATLDRFNVGALPELSTLEPTVMRQMYAAMPQPASVETVARVEDRRIPGPKREIPVRIYTPEGRGPFPALVFFHGGCFVFGGLETHDGTCRALTNAAGSIVISVDYALAPEEKFPAAPEECYAALRWVADAGHEFNVDPRRLAVGGDSAGGNLAAVVALMARDRGGPSLAHQLLIYPVTNHAFDTASYVENASGYLLTRDMMIWAWKHYLADEQDGRNPLASPLRADDLSGLPPALVITAEFDPLRDEGEAYAARLREVSVPTRCTRYDGMFHGFFSMGEGIDKTKEAMAEAGQALRAAFG